MSEQPSTLSGQPPRMEGLGSLDQRISRIEAHLGLVPIERSAAADRAPGHAGGTSFSEDTSSELENRIGEFGLAWIGSAILILGIAFLMTYTYGLGFRVMASLIGFGAAVGLYLLARVWNDSATYLSHIIRSGSLILAYYATLKLHFFTVSPVLADASLALWALLVVVAAQFAFGMKTNSQVIVALAGVLALFSGLLSGRSAVGFAIMVVVAGLAVALDLLRNWRRLLLFSVAAVYGCHLIWLVNNPLAGRELGAAAPRDFPLIYVFACAAVFSIATFRMETSDRFMQIAAVMLNSVGFSVVVSLSVVVLYPEGVAPIYGAIAAFFLILAALQWRSTHHPLAPSAYACVGNLALSVAVYSHFGIPQAFLWLSLQSLLVVALALWFRSKVLVVANSVIFLFVLAFYVLGAQSSNWVNFSIALAAHATARIMNWQRERLTLQTDKLRICYLLIGFVFVLYGLYHAVPRNYVTLSWMAAGAVYFLLSIVLQNARYRRLAIACALVTVSYLLAFDLARLDSKFRVPAFLSVGVTVLVISLTYTKFRNVLGKK